MYHRPFVLGCYLEADARKGKTLPLFKYSYVSSSFCSRLLSPTRLMRGAYKQSLDLFRHLVNAYVGPDFGKVSIHILIVSFKEGSFILHGCIYSCNFFKVLCIQGCYRFSNWDHLVVRGILIFSICDLNANC